MFAVQLFRSQPSTLCAHCHAPVSRWGPMCAPCLENAAAVGLE